jgi:hypothetical protein
MVDETAKSLILVVDGVKEVEAAITKIAETLQ